MVNGVIWDTNMMFCGVSPLLVDLGIPDNRSMRPERKPQADDIRKKQQDCGEPAVGADGFDEESVVNGRDLRIVAAPTIPILWVR